MDYKLYKWITGLNVNGLFINLLPNKSKDIYVNIDPIIQRIAKEVYHYGNKKNRARDAKARSELKNTPINEIFENYFLPSLESTLTKIMSNYSSQVSTLRKVYIVGSGTYNAKMIQDLHNTTFYNSTKEPEHYILIDPNSFFPGTPLSISIYKHLQNIMSKIMETQGIKEVIILDYTNPGNSHDKIFSHMSESVVNIIVGFNTDTFVTSLNHLGIYITDPYMFDNYPGHHIIVDVFKQYIRNVGNFTLLISLIESKSKYFMISRLGYLLKQSQGIDMVTVDKKINWKGLTKFLGRIKKEEKSYYIEDSKKDYEHESTLYRISKDGGKLNYNKYKDYWYSYIFNYDDTMNTIELNTEINEMVGDFLVDIQNTYNYLSGLPYNVNYNYKYHFFPLIDEIYEMCKHVTTLNIKPEGYNYDYIDQLIAILPRYSNELLNRKIRGVVNTASSLADMYPVSVPIYNQATNIKDRPIVLLPLVSMQRIKRMTDPYKEVKQQTIYTLKLKVESKCVHCLMKPKQEELAYDRELHLTNNTVSISKNYTIVNYQLRRDLLCYIEFLNRYAWNELERDSGTKTKKKGKEKGKKNVVIIHDYELPFYLKDITYIRMYLDRTSAIELTENRDISKKKVLLICSSPFYTYYDVLKELTPDATLFLNVDINTGSIWKKQYITFYKSVIYAAPWSNKPYMIVEVNENNTLEDINYDPGLIANSIKYHEYAYRPNKYPAERSKIKDTPFYYDSCYDCVTELNTITSFIKSFKDLGKTTKEVIDSINKMTDERTTKLEVRYNGITTNDTFINVYNYLYKSS